MIPADNGQRKYQCPFVYKLSHIHECELEMYFHELVAHITLRHELKEMMAWIMAATWEDVCSSMDERCE